MIKTTRKSRSVAAKTLATKAAPSVTETVKSEQIKIEPFKTTLAKAAPIDTQPGKTEPAKAEAVKTVPPPGSRVSLELVKPEARTVCVAGTFNGWKPEKTPLVRQGNGRWAGDLSVKAGRYEYLFVVDGQWLPDPNAKESVQNPFGGKNSVLVVSE